MVAAYRLCPSGCGVIISFRFSYVLSVVCCIGVTRHFFNGVRQLAPLILVNASIDPDKLVSEPAIEEAEIGEGQIISGDNRCLVSHSHISDLHN